MEVVGYLNDHIPTVTLADGSRPRSIVMATEGGSHEDVKAIAR